MGARYVVAVLALVLATAGPAAAAPSDPLGHAGRWIADAEGRVVVLHGFNVVPFAEPIQPRDMGMGADNARWLADRGFNTVRLGLYHARIEPRPGVFDAAYLDDYERVQRELAAEGIFALLDFHQDQLNPRYGTGGPIPSRGFADWFVRDDGVPNTQAPYPSGYFGNPALNRAYDNLWANAPALDGTGVQDHIARAWQLVARRFAGRPGLLGYDVFNEPWPGTAAASCVQGCPPGGFDQTALTDFTRRMVAALRAVDPAGLVFYEPNLQFDFGAPTGHGDPGDPNAVFSFHDYCFGSLAPGGNAPTADQCRTQEELVVSNALAHVEQTGDGLLLTEIGFDPAAAARMMALADREMVGWQWWDYYGDNVEFAKPSLPSLIRPYPQVVAGTPERWSFDPDTRAFALAYGTARARGEGARSAATAPGARFPAGSRTEVFVPELHYPAGYRVEVTGAEAVSAPGARRLELATCAGAARVTLRLVPGPSSVGGACPAGALPGGAGGPAPRPAGAPAPRCLPRRLRVHSRGIGPVRLGLRTSRLARYRVTRRRGAVLRFCVDGGGMVVVALRRGLVDLVASTARGHRTRVSGPGARVERQRRRVSGGLLVRGGRVVYGVGAGRVRFVAIVRPAVARSPRALARALAAAGLVRARRGAGTP